MGFCLVYSTDLLPVEQSYNFSIWHADTTPPYVLMYLLTNNMLIACNQRPPKQLIP